MTSRRLIADSRVLITGASSGIGRALAEALAARRARLILLARRRELLKGLAERLSGGVEGRVDIVAGDVTSAETRQKAIEAVKQRWGALDILINNAGVSAHGRFTDSDDDTMRRIMEVNLFAAVDLTRLAIPLLGEGRRPAVVNIGSVLGHRGAPHNGEYCASKFALRGWSEALRAELAGDDIDVLLVSPGTTDTEFFDHLIAKRGVLPWLQTKGVSPNTVADQTLRALERGRREIYPNWRGRLLVAGNRLFPGFVDRWMKRYGR